MNCECSFNVQPKYLFVKAKGSYDEQLFINLPRLIKEACQVNSRDLVLFDGLEIKDVVATTTSRYELGLEIARVFKNEFKLAAVWPIHSTNYYSQTIAKMNGTQLKVFGSEKEAKDWLLS